MKVAGREGLGPPLLAAGTGSVRGGDQRWGWRPWGKALKGTAPHRSEARVDREPLE